MASMMTSSQDGKIRAISDKEWTERRRKELFPEELSELSVQDRLLITQRSILAAVIFTHGT